MNLLKPCTFFQIKTVVDIRGFPGSRRFPQFNKAAMEVSLPVNGIAYVHFKNLGGRRKAKPDSKNTAWHHPSFKGYADYMETDQFIEGITALEQKAIKKKTAFMCSEILWWRCHRSMVSDFLKVHGWQVNHIMAVGKEQEHRFTSPARVVNGELTYVEK
jgi:uncharacterized protein (DUF488 family)